MRSKALRLSADATDRQRFYYFLMAVIVIRYEATTTARWASFFSVRTFFNDAITVAIWTGFHARLMRRSHAHATIEIVSGPIYISAMSSSIRYWTLHWLRVALWPAPVLSLFRAGRWAMSAIRRR